MLAPGLGEKKTIQTKIRIKAGARTGGGEEGKGKHTRREEAAAVTIRRACA